MYQDKIILTDTILEVNFLAQSGLRFMSGGAITGLEMFSWDCAAFTWFVRRMSLIRRELSAGGNRARTAPSCAMYTCSSTQLR